MKVQDLFNSPKPVAGGSIPPASTKYPAVVQLVEHRPSKSGVASSNLVCWSTQICWAIKPSLRLRLQAFLTVYPRFCLKIWAPAPRPLRLATREVHGGIV